MVYAEVRPNDKADVVYTLKRDGRRVAFVGDGLNDAPALTIADVRHRDGHRNRPCDRERRRDRHVWRHSKYSACDKLVEGRDVEHQAESGLGVWLQRFAYSHCNRPA